MARANVDWVGTNGKEKGQYREIGEILENAGLKYK